MAPPPPPPPPPSPPPPPLPGTPPPASAPPLASVLERWCRPLVTSCLPLPLVASNAPRPRSPDCDEYVPPLPHQLAPSTATERSTGDDLEDAGDDCAPDRAGAAADAQAGADAQPDTAPDQADSSSSPAPPAMLQLATRPAPPTTDTPASMTPSTMSSSSPSQPSAPRRRMFVDLDPAPATTPAGYFAGIDAPASPSLPDSAVTMHSPHAHSRVRSGSTHVPEPLRFGSLAVAGEDMAAKPVRRDRNGFAEGSVFFDPGNVEPDPAKRGTSTVATPVDDGPRYMYTDSFTAPIPRGDSAASSGGGGGGKKKNVFFGDEPPPDRNALFDLPASVWSVLPATDAPPVPTPPQAPTKPPAKKARGMIVGRDPPATETVEARGPAHRNSVFYEDFTVYPAPVPDDAPKPKPKRASIFDTPPSPVLPATPISTAPATTDVPALTIDTASTTSSAAPYKSKHLIPSPTTIIDDDESSASLPSPRRARSPALSSTASSPILIPVFRTDPPDAPWTDDGRHRPLAPPMLSRAARSAVDLVQQAEISPDNPDDLRAGYDPATLAVQYVPLRKNLLGTGLHAHVYRGTVRACAGAPARACAVKVLHELPESQLGGLREAWLLAQCRHAYVLQIVDVIDVANHVDEPAVVPAEDGGRWVRLSLENLGFPPPPGLLESSYVYEPPVKEALLAGKDVHGVTSKSPSRIPSRAASPVLSRPASPVAVAGPPPNVVPYRPPKPPEYALVLELCPGMSMWQFVTKNKTSIGRRLWMRWARQLAQAVAHLHARRIVHHDIKPHNILLDEYRGIKLSDLGSAEIVPEEGFFVDGLGKGTLAYLPPELTKPQPYNAAVDMYALGATLYVCGILGRDPFAGCSTPVHMIMAIERGFLAWAANLPAQHSRVADAAGEVDTRAVNLDTRVKRRGVPIPGSDPRDPRYVRFLNGDLVDEGIWKVLVQCLDRDPEKRPTATELVRELCALDGLDVEVEL